jgi:hypothetical protein
MKQTPSSDPDEVQCDYQVADWSEEPRSCSRMAVKTVQIAKGKWFNYCWKHWTRAESFIASDAPQKDL